MESKTAKVMKLVITDPASNVNQINQLFPALISAFSKAPKEVSKGLTEIITSFTKAKIIDR
jgi:hypothetical protein